MKYFIITDDTNFIFCNHPADPYGNLICLPIAVSQHNCSGWFSEIYTSLSCSDKTKLVFEQYGPIPLSFLVASDQGETETFLRSQLDLVHELLLMEFGEFLYNKKKIQVGYFQSPEIQKRIQTLIETLTYMCDQKQSFLVQSIEKVNINENTDLRQICEETSKNTALKSTTHTLLFVGTKELSYWANPKVKYLNLLSSDTFLLIIYIWSFYYIDLREDISISKIDEDNDSELSSGFYSAEEYWEDEVNINFGEVMELEPVRRNLAQGIRIGTSHEIIEIIQVILSGLGYFNGLCDGIFSERTFKALSQLPGTELLGLDTITLEVVQRLYDEALKAVIAAAENYNCKTINLTYTQCLSVLRRILDKRVVLETSQGSETGESPNSRLPYDIKESRPSTPKIRLGNSPSSNLSRSSSKSLSQMPVFRKLFLQNGNQREAYWIYISQLFSTLTVDSKSSSAMTLVEIMKDMTGNAEEKKKLEEKEQKISLDLQSYAEYLLFVESTYSMISYVHKLPGLVHFILVDRTTNKVYAPIITPLSGLKVNLDTKVKKKIMKLIKDKIWDLFYQSQEFLARGYDCMLMGLDDFQYYHNLWFETTNNTVIPPPARDHDPKTPLTVQYYSKACDKLEREYGQAIRCFELYALFVDMIPAKLIENYSQALISMVLGKKRTF